MTSLKHLLAGLLRVTALPVLRATGGVLWTISIPAFRALAGVCLVFAAVALASDAGPVSMGGPVRLQSTPVLTHWEYFSPSSLEATRGFVVKRMRPWVWDATSAPLRLPSFVFFTGLGIVFGFLGRRRRHTVIFVN